MSTPSTESLLPDSRYPSVFRYAAALFSIVHKSPQHPATLVSEYLQKKHRLKAEEKRAVSAAVFNALRYYPLAAYCAFEASAPVQWNAFRPLAPESDWFSIKSLDTSQSLGVVLAAAYLDSVTRTNVLSCGTLENVQMLLSATLKNEPECNNPDGWIREVHAAFQRIDERARRIIAQGNTIPEDEQGTLAIRYCVQNWILRSWAEKHGWQYAIDLASSLLTPSPVCIRVNTRMLTRKEAQARLLADGIASHEGLLSPAALILEERAPLQNHPLFTNGSIEVQDEGSQIIGFTTAPESNAFVLDACAGAGGKTMHLATLLQNTGRIIASDTQMKRLKEVLPRARRAGLTNIETIPVPALLQKLDRGEQYDCVLVDAPCTSLGTSRRMPHPKWRLAEHSMKKISAKQAEILERYAEAVAPGGTLVYATCSLLPQENEQIVSDFLSAHPEFRPDPIRNALNWQNVVLPDSESETYTLQLTPHIHGTDGFFMARMKRNSMNS